MIGLPNWGFIKKTLSTAKMLLLDVEPIRSNTDVAPGQAASRTRGNHAGDFSLDPTCSRESYRFDAVI